MARYRSDPIERGDPFRIKFKNWRELDGKGGRATIDRLN